MTVNEITEELKTQDDPITLSAYLTQLSAHASSYNEMMKRVQLKKPQVWIHIQRVKNWDTEDPVMLEREKSLSDTKTEMTWATTEDGQKEIALSYELKRIEQMMSAIKQRLYAMKVDFKSLNHQI
ncbi:MAG: hypothetical protein ABI995_02165 [Acidobacteriota bacterium]